MGLFWPFVAYSEFFENLHHKKAQKYGAKNVTFSYTPPHRKTTFRTSNRRSFFDGRERFCLQKGGEWAIKEALFYAFGEGIVIL